MLFAPLTSVRKGGKANFWLSSLPLRERIHESLVQVHIYVYYFDA